MHLLTYKHTRDLFSGSGFKPWVKKYFPDAQFDGTEYGNWNPSILVGNYEEVKNNLPISYRPITVLLCANSVRPDTS